MEKKEYTNGEVTIIWQQSLCEHSANCVRSNSAVFSPKRKPWIDTSQGTTEEIIEAVKKCPSGALSYRLNSK